MHISWRCRKAGSRPSAGWKESEGQLDPPNPSGKTRRRCTVIYKVFFWQSLAPAFLEEDIRAHARHGKSSIKLLQYFPSPPLPRSLPHQPRYPVIPGEDTTCQAKLGVVGSLHNLLLCVKWQNGHDRPKDLFLHTCHVICAVPCKHGRAHVLQEEELAAQPVHSATHTAFQTALSTAQPHQLG